MPHPTNVEVHETRINASKQFLMSVVTRMLGNSFSGLVRIRGAAKEIAYGVKAGGRACGLIGGREKRRDAEINQPACGSQSMDRQK